MPPKKTLKIPSSLYPGDRNIRDLIVAKNIKATALREFLRTKGIFPHTKNPSKLANSLSRYTFSYKELNELASYANLSDHSPKTTVNRLTLDVPMEKIVDFLRDDCELTNYASSVRIDDQHKNPTYNEEEKSVKITQPFKKVDYRKTLLLQEVEHEYSIKIQQMPPSEDGETNSYEVIYSTTASESEKYFHQVRDQLEQLSPDTSYVHEIDHNELVEEQWNTFFDRLLDCNIDGYSFDSVEEVRLEAPSSSKEEGDQEEDEEDLVEEEEPNIKTLHASGKNLSEVQDIKDYRDKGYFIVSLDAWVKKDITGDESKMIKYRASFTKAGKFETEVIQTATLRHEDAKTVSTSFNLPKPQRIEFARSVHNEAFKIFDILLNQDE